MELTELKEKLEEFKKLRDEEVRCAMIALRENGVIENLQSCWVFWTNNGGIAQT